MPLAEDADPLPALASRLGPLAMLLVLDNAEHRADEVSALAGGLVRDTARLRIVVTSQVPLHAQGERLFRLAPLPLPEAVRLLAERAGAAAWSGDEGEQAAAICRELDGNALAIELAAARVDALGLEGLALRLHQRLTLLAPGDAVRPSRRNALAAAMDWSHELLSERERLVLRRLGVFPGSFSLEGAALMLGDESLPAARVADAVLSLVDRSLISVERSAQRRFRLLETTRLFALERLDAAGETEARGRVCAPACAGFSRMRTRNPGARRHRMACPLRAGTHRALGGPGMGRGTRRRGCRGPVRRLVPACGARWMPRRWPMRMRG